jgi:hypothetical protein
MEPKLYDSMCDLDSWLIREKSAVECQGACFKWQQVLNNSGVLSYSTIRDCFERVCFYERQIKDAYIQHYTNAKFYYWKMFDPSIGPPTPSSASPTYTTECKHIQSPLSCLDQSSVEEHTCFCIDDFCNSAKKNDRIAYTLFILSMFISMLW